MERTRVNNWSIVLAIILCLIVISCIFTTITFTSITETAFANATNEPITITDGMYDNVYTGSDYMVGYEGNSQYTIQNYPNVRNTNILSAYQPLTLNVQSDDLIVKIVPKELLCTVGTYLYIGKEYGFFVKTENYGSSYIGTNVKSHVLVFDVINTVNLDGYAINPDAPPDTVGVKVQPLFQYKYVYLCSPNLKYGIEYSHESSSYDTVIFNQSQNGLVVLMGQTHAQGQAYSTVTFPLQEKYYLSDISFAANLYNTQALNYGDADYDGFKDDGAFFTRADYYYTGKYATENEFTDENFADIIKTLLTCSIELLIPIDTTIFTVIDGIIQIADIISGSVGVSMEATSNDNAIFNCNYTTRQGQMTNAPFGLAKSAALYMNCPADKKLVYGQGDYARQMYTLSYTHVDGQAQKQIDFSSHIALKILDEDLNYVTCNGGQPDSNEFISSLILKPDQNELLKMDVTDQIYLLPGGRNTFRFNPQFTSDYTFKIITDEDLILKVNGNVLTGVNNEYTVKLTCNNQNIVEVLRADNSAERIIADITVSPSTSLTDISLPSDTQYLLKYTPSADGVFTLNASAGALIADVFTLNPNGNLVRVELLDFFAENDTVDVYLSSGQTYYILLKNDGISEITTDVSIEAVNQILTVGNNNSINLTANDNFKYFKFNTASGTNANYKFLFSGLLNEEDIINFRVLNAQGTVCGIISYSFGYLEALSLTPNSVYYIGVKSSASVQSNVEITKSELMFAWKVFKAGSSANLIQPSSPVEINLFRGFSYIFQLWINDTVKVRIIDIINDSNLGLTKNSLTGEINISTDRFHNNHFILGGLKDDESVFTYTLKVIPKFDADEIIFDEVFYENASLVSWQANHLYSVKYKVTGQTPTNIAFNFVGETFDTNVDVLKKLIDAAAYQNVFFNIYLIKIQTGISTYTELEVNRSISINCQYSRYGSEKVIFTYYYYYITNALHLRNSEYYSDRSLKGDCSISLAYYPNWVPIKEFNNRLTGCTVTDLKIHIDANNVNSTDYFGLIGINNGFLGLITLKEYTITSTVMHNTPTKFIGGLVGKNSPSGEISFCLGTGNSTVHMQNSAVGGIVGINYGTAAVALFGSTTSAQSKIFGNGDLGGIAGMNMATLDVCQVSNTRIELWIVYTNRSAGGAVGYNPSGSINAIIDTVDIVFVGSDMNANSLKPNMGIVVGHIEYATLDRCTRKNSGVNTGSLTAKQRANCANGKNGLMGYIGPNVIVNDPPTGS